MLNRAYSLLQVKAVDTERRVILGIATTPEPDRVGDIVEPKGVKFKNPAPLLLYHDSQRPVGTVKFERATDDGIRFEARIPEVTEPGTLKDRVDEAWQSVKAGLIKGVSIGFRVLEDGAEMMRSGGVRFTKTEVLELSLVAIPANASAVIDTIKSLDAPHLAASGRTASDESNPAGVSAPTRVVVKTTTKGRIAMKRTHAEQIASLKATREEKSSRIEEIQAKASDDNRTKDAAEREEFDNIKAELKSLDEEIKDLEELSAINVKAATAPAGASTVSASASRQNVGVSHVQVKDVAPPEIQFARAVMCKLQAFSEFQKGNFVSAADIARARYGEGSRPHQYLKAAVPAGTSTDAVWASPLVDTTNLANEFIEYLRPQTIVGRIPGLRRIPFNVRIVRQTGAGDGYWVGQGAPKPLTSFAFDAVTHPYAKLAAIAVITEELARFSTPSAEGLVRDSLSAAIIERQDIDFIHPGKAAVANVSPASITNGLTALSSAGTTADNIRTDIQNLLEQFVINNVNPTGLVLIMPNTLALALSVLVNSLGNREFPDITMMGGALMGIPVVTSQYAANDSGSGNLVIAVNAGDIFLSDDGGVTVDASREASLQMLDNPTNNSSTATPTTMVSMFQTNSIALRAERWIYWSKRRSNAVVFMDDVNWGAIGSPA